MIEDSYAKARLIDLLKLSPEYQLKYKVWMDSTRRMQGVLDDDQGKGSPEALQALRALWAGWIQNALKGR